MARPAAATATAARLYAASADWVHGHATATANDDGVASTTAARRISQSASYWDDEHGYGNAATSYWYERRKHGHGDESGWSRRTSSAFLWSARQYDGRAATTAIPIAQSYADAAYRNDAINFT